MSDRLWEVAKNWGAVGQLSAKVAALETRRDASNPMCCLHGDFGSAA